ncbi:MAG: c-type cytochrome [Hyphomonas sp.]
MCLAMALSGLTACGGAETPARDLTPEEVELKQKIDARRLNFQDLGAAFKAVGDELRAGRANSATVQFSVDAVARYSVQISSWFPEGSGPESGFRTDALPAIWENPEEFAAILSNFEASAALFAEASQSGNASAIQSNFQLVGAGCVSCHDKFRKD